MIIQLSDSDLEKMPSSLSAGLLQWLQSRQTKVFQEDSSLPKTEVMPQQLALNVDLAVKNPKASQRYLLSKASQFTRIRQPQQGFSKEARENSHVRISQLFDIGLLSEKTQIRIRLKQDRAKQVGYSYITSVQISSRGTVIYEGEEFDKPSP
jgi:hypothetical protein